METEMEMEMEMVVTRSLDKLRVPVADCKYQTTMTL